MVLSVKVSALKHPKGLYNYDNYRDGNDVHRVLLYLKPHPALHTCKESRALASNSLEKYPYLKYDQVEKQTSPRYKQPSN